MDLEMARLSPSWQRIAAGEVDLSQFSDEEILTMRLPMADGRTLPPPKVVPENFAMEQRRRGFKVAERKIREGAQSALDVYREVLDDDTMPARDRLAAGKFFTDRFLGSVPRDVNITHNDARDPREVLVEVLLAARDGEPDVIEGEVVDEDDYDLL